MRPFIGPSKLLFDLNDLITVPHAIYACRYDTFLRGSKKEGFYKGVAVGASVGSIYFLIFLVYAVSFW